jgi:hypothetical protein
MFLPPLLPPSGCPTIICLIIHVKAYFTSVHFVVPPVQTGSEAHPAFHKMGTWSFLGTKRPRRGVEHPPHPAPRVKKIRAIPLLPRWAFVTCSRVNFIYTLTCICCSLHKCKYLYISPSLAVWLRTRVVYKLCKTIIKKFVPFYVLPMVGWVTQALLHQTIQIH